MIRRKINFKYNLLDRYENFKKVLTSVESANITFSSLGRIKGNLNATIKEDLDIDYMNDRVQPIVIINDKEYSLGIYCISSPNRDISSIKTLRELECYSKLKLLDNDKVLERYYVPIGTNVVNEVLRLLGRKMHNTEPSGLTPSTNKECELGTPKLDIINDLLDFINYNSLSVDTEGKFISSKYVLPEDREATIYYEEGRDSIILNDMTEDIDFYNIPNIFVRYTNNEDINPPLRVVYPIQTSDTIITLDGRSPVVDAEEVQDVADTDTLMSICKRDWFNKRNSYSHLSFETAINPIHGYLDCIKIKVGDVNDKFIETSWSMELKVGGKMNHTVRRVVQLW